MTAEDLRRRWSRGDGKSLRSAMLWSLAVLVVLQVAHGMGGVWLRWTQVENPTFLEALTWWHGGLSLPYRLWDTAYVVETGKAYNVFPPLQSILAFCTVAPAQLIAGGPIIPELAVLPPLVFGLPFAVVGYAVLRRRVGGPFWALVLTLGWLGGTAVWPCLEMAREYRLHQINHLLSQVGLLLLAGELVGRRRVWVAALGLLIAAWSRQLTALFTIALLAAAWEGESDTTAPATGAPSRRRRMVVALAGLAVIAGVPMGLNWAKFGSPILSGYELIYVGRDHALARDARAHGLFSPRFVGRNAYYMNVAVPWARAEDGAVRWRPSEHGTAMWLTTPLLALVLLGVRTWWRQAASRTLMLCTVPIIAALLLYHGTGHRQVGYYRFALDFLPVWLVVSGPWLASGWRRYATPACVAWSVTYFVMLDRWTSTAEVLEGALNGIP